MSKSRAATPVALAEMTDGQEADLFVLLSEKQEQRTRDGKPYWRVTFRDARRQVSFPIWGDAPLAEACHQEWSPGEFYKVRAVYRQTSYGPQLDLKRVRRVVESDAFEGFDPQMLQPSSRYEPQAMFDQLRHLAESEIANAALRSLVLELLDEHHPALLNLPAATHNHHCYVGGFLEHVLSVTQTAVFLADKYSAYYADMQPPLNRDLVVAGAILHDIGKVQELSIDTQGASYTPAGMLIGHVLQGRDMVRAAASAEQLEAELLLRLEHLIVSHQRLPEWGSPKPPMTPEALLVHFADDIDAKYHMVYAALGSDTTGEGDFTSRRNVLGQRFYRGPSTGK